MLRITFERRARGMNQTRLAALALISQADVSRLERGIERAYPAHLRRVAAVLGVRPPERLLEEIGDEPVEIAEASLMREVATALGE